MKPQKKEWTSSGKTDQLAIESLIRRNRQLRVRVRTLNAKYEALWKRYTNMFS